MQPMLAQLAPGMPPGAFPAADRGHLAAHGPLIRNGVRVAFSSDLPVLMDPNPWPGIRAAVEDPINGISLLRALRAYTAGGAYASWEERSKGTLDAGMLADLQIYAGDPLEVARAGWDELRPAVVLLGGTRVL